MKTILSILFIMIAIPLTACDQKPDLAAKAVEAGKEAAQKVQNSAQQTANDAAKATKEAAKEVASDATKAAKEAAEAGKEGAIKSVAVVKETTEQALASTVDAAQKLTKTQESKPRQRAQNAEAEMLRELEKSK